MTTTKRLERTGVMLATPLEEKILSKFPDVNWLQPKLNGERCRAVWNNAIQSHVLYSSYGKEFKFLSRIESDLRRYFPGMNLDGELYVHGWSREKIHSIVSRKTTLHKNVGDMQYHIFDVINDRPQWYRVQALSWKRCAEDLSSSRLHVVETGGHGKVHIPEAAESFVKAGYEGLIIRHYSGFYEPKRSKFLLKFKPSKVDRYVIIKALEEIDKDGYPKNTLGALRVSDHSYNEFNVGTGAALTKETRKRLWDKKETLPGRFAVVKHSIIYTVGGFPTCTSLLEIE